MLDRDGCHQRHANRGRIRQIAGTLGAAMMLFLLATMLNTFGLGPAFRLLLSRSIIIIGAIALAGGNRTVR